MKHSFQWLSGATCTDAQEADVGANVCASDLARAAFPHLRVAMLMPLVLVSVPPLVPSLANHGTGGQENRDDCDTSEAGSFQMCDPSDLFPKPTTFAVVDLSPFTLKSCAQQGLVNAGKWVFAATGREWTNGVMRAAAYGGHLEFAQWARAEGCDWGSNVMYASARNSHFKFAQWAKAEGCDFGSHVMYAAASNGNLEFAQWAKAKGCQWGYIVMYAAAYHGHLEFAKWAKAEGCQWSNDVLKAAAYNGHLEFAKWAKAEGCDFGSHVMYAAAQGGHLEFAKWVRSQGCDD